MAELTVSSQTLTASTAITKMAGDMDAGSFDMVEDEFNKLLESGILGLVLDVSALDSLTSSGLGAVVNLSQMLSDRKGKLVLAAPRPKVLGLLEMLGLCEVLTVTETAEQARKLVASIK